MKKLELKGMAQLICSVLMLAAPFIVTNSACSFLWGEPEVPEVLK